MTSVYRRAAYTSITPDTINRHRRPRILGITFGRHGKGNDRLHQGQRPRPIRPSHARAGQPECVERTVAAPVKVDDSSAIAYNIYRNKKERAATAGSPADDT